MPPVVRVGCQPALMYRHAKVRVERRSHDWTDTSSHLKVKIGGGSLT
jgi:hypothetical protein